MPTCGSGPHKTLKNKKKKKKKKKKLKPCWLESKVSVDL
jgi:hypothetical protein